MTQAVPTSPDRPKPHISFEEFLDYGEEGERFEWVAGELIEMPSPSVRHQFLVGFLLSILRWYVQEKALGAVLHESTVRLPQRPSGRIPDILFVSHANQRRLRRNYLDGAADFAIEVVSPGTEKQDRGAKFDEYERAGIAEYWIIDTANKSVEFYQLDASGSYQSILPDAKGVYHSSVIAGLWIKTEWLWNPSIAERTVYQEWGLL